MKIVCIGGGPAGLYFALLMKQLNPAHHITVVERNRPYDTFGWGVVFSDATLDTMRQWDAATADTIESAFNHWDDILLLFKGQRIQSGGHGFVGIGRKRLLNILQSRCEALGVHLVFEQEATGDEDFADADLIIASDGVNSRIRQRHAAVFKPDIVTRPNRFIWLGTHKQYPAFTFDFQRTAHGWFQAHIYQFDGETSTFIVECPESVWLAHGLDQADPDASIAFCEQLFAENLQGAKLMTNARHLRGSAWLNFQRIVCEQWWLRNPNGSHVVLMGDAVHTAHFAIGSGTKLALEDGIELVKQFKALGDGAEHLPAVLAAYQEARRVETLRIQTRPGMRWSGSRSAARATATNCRPSSSCTACSRAANASATKTCGCGTRAGWRAMSAGLSGVPLQLTKKIQSPQHPLKHHQRLRAPPRRPCSPRSSCVGSRSRTGWWCRPWRSISVWAVLLASTTSCTWARARWAGQPW